MDDHLFYRDLVPGTMIVDAGCFCAEGIVILVISNTSDDGCCTIHGLTVSPPEINTNFNPFGIIAVGNQDECFNNLEDKRRWFWRAVEKP